MSARKVEKIKPATPATATKDILKPCQMCDKKFRTRVGLSKHVAADHKDGVKSTVSKEIGKPRRVSLPTKLKTPTKVLKEKEQNVATDLKDKRKPKLYKEIGKHSGVPVNPKLRAAAQALKEKLEELKRRNI